MKNVLYSRLVAACFQLKSEVPFEFFVTEEVNGYLVWKRTPEDPGEDNADLKVVYHCYNRNEAIDKCRDLADNEIAKRMKEGLPFYKN